MAERGKFLILGGGIAGLSAAYSLLQKVINPKNITLLESSSRLGGWIQTKRYEDGAIFELGPRGLRPSGPSGRASLQLAYDLGLENDVIAVSSDHVSARNRYIYAHNRMHKLPSGIGGLFRSQSLLSKNLPGILLKETLVPKRKFEHDESIHDFISRRFDSEVADYIIDPMCRGIFAGDIKKLSIKSCLPMVYNLEETSGSIVKGLLFGKSPEIPKEVNSLITKASAEKWSLWTFKRGLTTFVNALEDRLIDSGVSLLKDIHLTSLNVNENREIQVKDDQRDKVFAADHLISCIPSKKLAELLPNKHADLAGFLHNIKAVTVAVVNLEFEGSILEMEGFGYLYPLAIQKVLGVIFDSSTFSEGDRKSSKSTRLTVMMGGNYFEEQFGNPNETSKDHLKNEALVALKNALGIQGEPSKICVSIHQECIPQYNVGHYDLLQSIRQYIARHLPLSVSGSWYDGVGINDCIYYSQKTVDKILHD
ncbi:LOW QUALITY PROTEIN: protoporphyrinogen oxidase-like [Dendronephthya gigantea]|uniref:LOW QUALITY PROTEIN: protoporphyrinogen oxidase-like n=1 Tax=Dendronephthya gigantea TaxID=151771 RepID=UPI00106BDAA5|nr:LOW QUALITY PROTEIN: protoporphyrinogen oxidase-like [Dendronephthya gigantea]